MVEKTSGRDLIAKHFIRPQANRTDELHCSNPVICEKNFVDNRSTATALDELGGRAHLRDTLCE